MVPSVLIVFAVLLISDPSDLMLSAVPGSRLGVGSADGNECYGKFATPSSTFDANLQ